MLAIASALLLTLGTMIATARAACIGDCDNAGQVTVNNLIAMVDIDLGNSLPSVCPAGDADNSGDITIDEIITAVGNALTACPAEPTPTFTAKPTGTALPTATRTPMATPTPTTVPTPTATSTPKPEFTSFDPMSGAPGIAVTLHGHHLVGTSAVMFNGAATTFTVVSEAEISVTVPQGATSGPISITTPGGTLTSSSVFAVLTPSTFSLSLAPSSATVLQGQSTAYAVKLDSSNGFLQLANLHVSGLPAGVTATLTPPQITAGQTAILTLTAAAAQPTGTTQFSVSASATVLGVPSMQSAPATLSVQPVTTSFLGRTVEDDTMQTPLAGVTITFLGMGPNGHPTDCAGPQTISDAAGNFAFTNLPDECAGAQLVRYDGTTATAPPGKHAGVDLVYTIVSHQVVVSPVLVHLPRIDGQETVLVKQNSAADQTFTFQTIPFLSITVYAGTTLTRADGTQPDPFPLTAVQVPVDRLPEEFSPQAQSASTLLVFIVAFQPANAVASQPVAVTFPNSFNTPPGTQVTLMTLDPTRGQMVPYGTGVVANDGTRIFPNPDPANAGHNYGLVHFDWHGPTAPPPNTTDPGPQSPCVPGSCSCPTCDCAPLIGAKPVDVPSGLEVLTETDIAIGGGRGGLSIVRTYRSGSGNPGPFGIGTGHNYSYQLGITPGVINLVMPDGNQFGFNVQPDGTFVNSTIPALRGAVLRNPTNGVFDLRWREGTTFEFQTIGRITVLTSSTDANGNVTTLTHGSVPGQIAQVIDPVGRALSFQYDASSRITSITDPIGRMVQYTYNAQGTLATVVDAAGGTSSYAYDGQNRLTKVTDARGVVVAQNTYDPNGRVSQQTLADGGVYSFAYTLLNPAAPAVSPVLRTTVTDPLGNPTTYRFSPQGFLLDVTDASGQTRVFNREPGTNLPLSVTGHALCTSCGGGSVDQQSYTYDTNGNISSSTDALGNTTTFTYEPIFNQLASLTDPLGHQVTVDYDGRGNVSGFADANGKSIAFDYDAFGQLTRVTDPLGQQLTLSYDGLGDVAALTDPAGATISAVYDGVSRQLQSTDSLGRTKTTTYDALDRITAQTNAQKNTTQYAYDAVGNLRALTDVRGNTTSFTYDLVGRLATKTTPLGTTETSTYDADGNVVTLVDRRGQTSHFTYDALNRLIAETYQDGTTVTRSRDASGRLIQANDSVSGVFAFTHDLDGRLTSAAGPFGAVQYGHDGNGRVTARTVVGQAPVEYMYDPAGYLIKAATQGAQVDLAYDARNQILGLSRSNDVTSAYAYDKVARLRSVTHANQGGTLSSQRYSYDAAGTRTAVSSGIQPLATQPVSNQFDVNNRLIASGATSFTYDGNGNVTSATGPTGTITYTWDARNRLQSILAPNGQRTALLYDFTGNLISQSDSGPTLNRNRNFVLDDLTNVALIAESTGDQISVLGGRSVDQHFAIIHGSGAVEFALTDGINSTVATVDHAGNTLDTFSYEPFGQTTANGSEFPFQYTGRVPITGSLYSYRARYYDSGLGRFLSEDPLGFLALDANLYRYVGNSPTNLIDPDGQCCFVFIGAGVTAGAGLLYYLYQFLAVPAQATNDAQQRIICDPNPRNPHAFERDLNLYQRNSQIMNQSVYATSTIVQNLPVSPDIGDHLAGAAVTAVTAANGKPAGPRGGRR